MGGVTGARELAVVTGELGRRVYVRSAPGRGAVRSVVDAKDEVAVGEGLVRAGAGDPGSGIDGVEGPALTVGDVKEEDEEDICGVIGKEQGARQQQKGRRGWGWVIPLLGHKVAKVVLKYWLAKR